MTAYHAIEVAGTELWLLPEKAAYWPEQKVLLIADAHFGKAAAYRRLGQPVPHGTTDSNLRVLDQLLAQYPSQALVFLGDFLHGPGSHAIPTLAALAQWRARHPQLGIVLVRGNHDLRAGDPPAELGFEVVNEPLLLGPFAFQHDPVPCAGRHVLAGHVHPVYRLRGRGRQSLRLPCFQIGAHLSVLPAFGAFTGGYAVEREPGVRLFVSGDGQVWPVADTVSPGRGNRFIG
jgi:DNA ligase-associated metallophosphoesterase